MAIGTGLYAREVDTRVASLTVDVAGEIPVQVSAVPSDRGIWCLGDQIATALIDFLEEKGYIVPGCIPTSFEQRVLPSGPRSDGGVVKAGEVVIEAMDDNGCGLDFTGMEPSRGLAADGEGETEGKETDASHEG